MVFMWSVHLRSSKIVTPRYLADGTRSKLIHILEGWFVPGHMNDLAFQGLKFMSQSFLQFSRLSKSFCMIYESSCLSRARYMAVSSAKA